MCKTKTIQKLPEPEQQQIEEIDLSDHLMRQIPATSMSAFLKDLNTNLLQRMENTFLHRRLLMMLISRLFVMNC